MAGRAKDPYAADRFYARFKALALSLPGTRETMTWGSPHLRVGDKIFTGYSRDQDGTPRIGVRCDLALQQALVASDPRFTIAAYTGKYGGIDFRVTGKPDWDEIRTLVVGSYRIVAPKKLVAQLDGGRAGGASGARPKATRPSTRRPALRRQSPSSTPMGGSTVSTTGIAPAPSRSPRMTRRPK